MKQSEKLMQLLELMQANPELPVIPCVDGDAHIFQTPEHDICGKATSYKRTA